MPIGYLVTAALMAWCTVCALAPWPRRGILGTVSFRFGFLINEVPCLGIYWLVAASMLAFAEGDVHSIVGWLALTLTGAALLGLAVVVWRGATAGRMVDQALDAGLGPGWRAVVGAEDRRAGFPVGPVLFWPVRTRRRDVERVADIAYGDAGERNLLDVYRHRSRPAGCPVLVHLHGGALRKGRKNTQGLPLIYRMASRSWVCVSANYRLGPAATFPDHLIDVKKVLGWVRAHGAEYGADPAVVFVAGGSAGAYLAALASLTPNDPRYQPGFEALDTSVTGAVALYGVYTPFSAREPRGPDAMEASPIARVRPDAPPFFVAHGDRDTVAPVEGARRFVEALRAVSRSPVVYAELPGAQHVFDIFRSVRCDHVVKGIESFAAWVRSEPAARG